MEGLDVAVGDKRRLVLVVEDNDLNSELLNAILEQDFRVVRAQDGLEGIQLLDEHLAEVSLILLDVYMPRCDGFEFLRRKQQDARYDMVPVIVMTMSDDTEDELRCLRLGANDFLIKPYNADVMLNRIHNMIRLRETASIVNHLTHDKLTSLYNMEFFYQEANEVLAKAPDASFDLICSDINNFRVLNDRYGSRYCDTLLRELASYLGSHLPGVLVGGRLGGDTFVFLAEHLLDNWTHSIQDAMATFDKAYLGIRFGVLCGIDRALPVAMNVNRALTALKTIREPAGVDVAMFDKRMHERLHTEQIIRETMEAALDERQFVVYFQPKLDCRRRMVGGAEALVRWLHPTLGLVSPGVFIPLFERNGFITRLDLYVWEETCRELARCKELGLPQVPISMNASRIDFDDVHLAERLARMADDYGVERELLHVELTETAFTERPDLVCKTMDEFRGLGFKTELDDFGSGYSSLASLNTLPLDIMKLDMSLVQRATELDDFRIVEASIDLAHTLGLKTVVEGVELESEAKRVSEAGCDFIQGYYHARPLDRDGFEAYLRMQSANLSTAP